MQVTTNYGKIKGIDMGDYTVFKGVPYAKPPVGDLRWKAPQRMEPWEGVYSATSFGNSCVQSFWRDDLYYPEFYADAEYIRERSEDCLYINIWAPNDNHGEKLPVAFWIHGGAFLGGYSSEKEFDGVILVSVEYRCNVFGFLAHPWLSAEDENGRSGNYGILDQIAALTWVYENIEAFGGDKDNITVFGQSAGAMSTQTLVSSKATGNMIAKAIFQSGGAYAGGLSRDIPQAQQEAYGKIFEEVAGVHSLEEMRALTTEEIYKLTDRFMGKVMPMSQGLFLTPVNDGYVLDDDYDRLIDTGVVKDIPYMLGTTKNDILVTPEILAADDRTSLYKGCITWSEKMEELGRKPAYVYYFTHDLPGDDKGAWHTCELWYMFGTLKRCWRPFTEEDRILSEMMLDYWTNFMKTGDPNGVNVPDWEPCTKDNPAVKIFA